MRQNILSDNHLSRLQKWILRTAFGRLSAVGLDMALLSKYDIDIHNSDRLYVAEIKDGYYKLKTKEHGWTNLPTLIHGCGPSGHFFENNDRKKHRAAGAAISRAMRRLADREFIEILHGANALWSAVVLTESGKELAAKLQAA